MLLSDFYKFFERSDVVSSFDHSSKYFLKPPIVPPVYGEVQNFLQKNSPRNPTTKKPRNQEKNQKKNIKGVGNLTIL